jgi:hypothetical protein
LISVPVMNKNKRMKRREKKREDGRRRMKKI